MNEVVIVDAMRTPIGALGGNLSMVRADDLAADLLKACSHRNAFDPAEVEEVYLGSANQAGEDNRNVARMALLLAGYPISVPGLTINRLCASSLAAVNLAARAIKAGDGDIFIAGGVESMSRAPYTIAKSEKAFGFGNQIAYDTSLGWRFPNPKMVEMYKTESMGETAENIAALKPHITRELQDRFALRSHMNSIAAMDSGRFADEIIPVAIPHKKGDPIIIAEDERPRRDTTYEQLSALRPAFRKDGSVTAGNSSGLNDGASMVLIMSAEKAKHLGLKPMARVVANGAAGVLPGTMGLGPVPATQKALKRAGLSIKDIELVELNEAFAIQSLAVMEDLNLDPEIVNINGGAIALGHPLGCSGARVLTTLVHEMRRQPKIKYGLATLCVGVGQGEALIVENMA